jgi:hypothetical protein
MHRGDFVMWKPIAALVASVAIAGTAAAQDGGKIPWNHDPAAAMKEAKKSGRPMMFFFTSPG